jgi:tetraacyldisaccharide 4'-kinase
VHVLDDGFQHFDLQRDADLVVIGAEDLERPVTLPGGRLREPLDVLCAADALIALDGAEVEPIANGRPVWRARRRQGHPRLSECDSATAEPSVGRAIAVAGIANPAGFFRELRTNGWKLARELTFRDHHRYSARDLAQIDDAARAAGAPLILTTEKDLVRLLPFRPFRVPVASVPLLLEIEATDSFDVWLRETADRDSR